MERNWSQLFTKDRLLRVLADVLMMNLALLVALTFRYVWIIGVSGLPPKVTSAMLTQTYTQTFLFTSLIISALSLVVFYMSGFYTYGRAYTGRYKALIVTQAVVVVYLLLGSTYYFSPFHMPRVAFLMALGMSLFMLVSARGWSYLWKKKDMHKQKPTNSEVKRVLVIGGAGYIGSALLPRLLDRGYQVRLLDLLLYGNDPIEDIIDHPNLEIFQEDFRQIDVAFRAMKDVDAVIHLGAIVGDPACAFDEKLTIEINLVATRMLGEIAKACGVHRFVFASTCSVYGKNDEVLDEHSKLNPLSLYAESKAASETVLHELADETFSPTLLRFGTIYGFSGRVRFDLVVNLLTAKSIIDGEITIFGGDQWRPFVHVQDAAKAVQAALEGDIDVVHKETFNVGSNAQNYTIDQVGELIHKTVPESEVKYIGSDGDKRNYRVNFDKIENVLGFLPDWTVEKGIQQVIDAIEAGEVENYRDIQYSNLKFMQERGSSSLLHSYTEEWMDKSGYKVPSC